MKCRLPVNLINRDNVWLINNENSLTVVFSCAIADELNKWSEEKRKELISDLQNCLEMFKFEYNTERLREIIYDIIFIKLSHQY